MGLFGPAPVATGAGRDLCDRCNPFGRLLLMPGGSADAATFRRVEQPLAKHHTAVTFGVTTEAIGRGQLGTVSPIRP